jgi:GNAT superfamily N-acetyltransferase
MIDRIEITRLSALPSGIEALRTNAARQGFRFVERLVSAWTSGANTFSQPGERFLGAFSEDRLVGLGGLNRDPYAADPAVGRIRHLYVNQDCRRRGIGRAIVDRLLGEAIQTFRAVRLRTDSEAAAAFYLRCGFSPSDDPAASHGLKFEPRK